MFPELFALDLPLRVGVLVALSVVLVLWTRSCIVPQNPGWARIFCFLPVLAINLFLSMLFNFNDPGERVLNFYAVGVYLLICSFKVAALCFNRGQLTKVLDSGSLAVFAAALLLPINIAFEKKAIDQTKKTYEKVAPIEKRTVFKDVEYCLIKLKGWSLAKELSIGTLRLFGKGCFWYYLATVSKETVDYSFKQSVVNSWFLYMHFSTLEDLNDLITLAALNIKLTNNFDKPYLATSISNFWAKRWNLIVHRVLQDLFYLPMIERSWIARENQLHRVKPCIVRTILGMMNVFIASALLHAFFLMKILNTTEIPTLLASFFVLNAVVVSLERCFMILLKYFGLYNKSPSFLQMLFLVPYMQGVILTLAHFFFWPDFVRMHFIQDLVDGVSQLGNTFQQTNIY